MPSSCFNSFNPIRTGLGGKGVYSPSTVFLPFIKNIFRRLIPETSWLFQIVGCRCPYDFFSPIFAWVGRGLSLYQLVVLPLVPLMSDCMFRRVGPSSGSTPFTTHEWMYVQESMSQLVNLLSCTTHWVTVCLGEWVPASESTPCTTHEWLYV